jgi:acetyl esterase/lipase
MTPTHSNIRYGNENRQTCDLYLADSDGLTPLLFFVHGGGFRAGDKDMVLNRIPMQKCLDAGISVSSSNYRLTPDVMTPTPYHDSARALKFIRHNADEFNIDETRIAGCGTSAGSGIVQWLAYHPDLADSNSDDPVESESTSLTCVLPLNAQHTYDPRIIRDLVPGDAFKREFINDFYGLPETFDWDTNEIAPDLDALINDASPLYWLTKDAPPIFVSHKKSSEVPGQIHHPNFGRDLKRHAQDLDVTCVQRIDNDFVGDLDFENAFMKFLSTYLI